MKQPISFILLAFLVIISSCKNKQNENLEQLSNSWEFRELITSFPIGQISKKDPIQIFLAQELEGYETGDELPKKWFSISPSAKGSWRLADKSLISFEHEEPLKSDQVYQVRLATKKLFPNQELKKDFLFRIKTVKPDFSVIIDAIQNSLEKENEQVIYGHIESADIINREDVSKVLSAKQNQKALEVDFFDANSDKYFDFVIKGIDRKENESDIKISWNGKPVQIDNKGYEIISLPGKNNFQVIRSTVQDEPEQLVEINFSGEIEKNQNLNGLLQIGDKKENIKYSIDGNILRLYPSATLNGDIDVQIAEGVKSVEGLSSDTFFNTLAFKGAKPNVHLISNGTILPNSQGLKIHFEATSLKAIDVRVSKIYEKNALQFLQVNYLSGDNEMRRVARPVVYQRMILQESNDSKSKAYSLDLAPLIQADPGAIYQIELSYKKEYSIYNCGQENVEILEEEITYYNGKDSYWDRDSYYDNYWDYQSYNWRERDNPCDDGYYNNARVITTNVLASDIGIITKREDNGHVKAITTNLVTAKAESGVQVNFYNFQMKLLSSATSNSKGFADYEGDEEVFLVEASLGQNKSYVRMRDGQSLNVSQFSTDGYSAKQGLKGMIYGERGIWRPGDNIHLSFLLNDKDNPLPDDHPIKFQLKDPKGVVVDEQLLNQGTNGFYRFDTSTSQSSITGNYTARITVGNVSFYKTLPIEKIKPNRLKINFTVEDDLNANIETKWLHGASAGNLKATVDANIRQKRTSFEDYKSYVFDDPTINFEAEEIRVFDGTVNDAGSASFAVDLGDVKAPGKLRTTYITKVFEKGGSFSIDAFSKDYSPYNSYVGLSMPKTDNFYEQLETDTKNQFQVVTVDKDGQPKSVRKLSVEVYKINFRWWWNRSNENLSSYISSESHKPIYEKELSTGVDGKANFDFEIKYPEWGRYLVRVVNEDSGHATGETVYIDWPSWRGRDQRNNGDAPNILSFTTDKEEYKVGESVKVNFPSSNGGRALVSIESGTKVIDAFWVEPKNEFTSFSFKTTKEMAPNVYVNITYLQQHANTANDLPIRLYGIVPISVYDAKTKLDPKILMSDELEPEEVYKVKVKESKGKPMTYTLAVVDEGLLDLTRFKTPNAWDQFFQKQALGVKTWDVYDDVIGAYSGRIDQILSIGGGDEAEAAGAKKAQRFKPVVSYLGPFELNAGQTKTHEIKMPYYVGSVRVMVVAGNRQANSFGSAEKAVPVKKPLMILGTLPRKITQNELIDLPVSVFAMDEKVKNVNLEVKTNDILEIVGIDGQSINFTQTGEKEAEFQLKATGKTGIGKVEIIASGNGETAKYEVEVDVLNPNERESKFTDLELEPNSEISIPVNAISINGSDEASLQISTIPNLDFSKRVNELIRYPHGCAEQVTSSVFSQLYLSDIANTTKGQNAEMQTNVQDAIYRLKNYQANDGGFYYWPGANTTNDFVSSYVGHFLLEAKNKGFQVPSTMISNWKQYQSRLANQNYSSSSEYNQFLQAYRLYTLALAGNANLSAMNRLREQKDLNKETRWRLAAAYAVAGQNKPAAKLINAINDDFSDYNRRSFRYGSALRNKAMALETALLLDNESLSKGLMQDIAKDLSKNRWYSTQTTSYSLYSLSKFLEKNGGSGISVSLTDSNSDEKIDTDKPMALQTITPPNGSKTIRLKNNKDNKLYVRLNQSGIPPVGQETSASKGLSLTTEYFDIEGKKIDINQLPQTTEFVAKIKVRNLSKDYVDHIALTQVIPSGWEIVNTRYTDLGNNQPSQANYIDIRDDRVHYYFSLGKEDSKTFQMQMNASFTGNYYLPGSRAEAMYDQDNFYVKQKGKWVEVVE